MTRNAIIEIHKEEVCFSAGHFTIFSATQRENLHGHNYNVSAAIETQVGDNGLTFDYRVYRNKLQEISKTLDLRFLLPAHSKFLKIEDAGDMLFAHYNNERIPFLKRDVLVLPMTNVTLEELSNWFLNHLLEDKKQIAEHHIQSIIVKVYNGPGHSGAASWKL